MAPSGSDLADGTTTDTPWATFQHAWTILAPGDTLTLLDGVYRQELLQPPSGAIDAPITVRALHDGGAVIDGEDVRQACALAGMSATERLSNFVLDGVFCRSPIETSEGGEAAVLVYHADRIVVHRVSGYGVGDGAIGVFDGNDVVLEDVAAYGGGSTAISVGYSRAVTIRRCYARWRSGPPSDAELIRISETSDTLVENCVGVASPDGTATLHAIMNQSGAAPSNDNRFLANVTRGPATSGFVLGATTDIRATGTIVRDLAAIGPGFGFFQRNDAALVADHLTLVGAGMRFAVAPNIPADVPTELQVTLTRSVLSGGSTGLSIAASPLVTRADHHDNVFDQVAMAYADAATPGANESQLALTWDTAKYGDGAYLMRPEGARGAGAELLYRTVDGALTTTPLWPWPMEDRILAEDNVSVTWDARGGIWRAPPPVTCP